MNRLIKSFIILSSIFAVLFTAGCKDELVDEITELRLSRLFSPTDISVRVVNQTSVILSWKAVKHAESYTIEFFRNGTSDFSGTPERTVSDILFDQLPITIPGFSGETAYSFRVKAVGDDINDSKWVSATFTTGAEQILFPVDPDDITANSVIIRWPAGEAATHITLTPGDINQNLTESELAEGAVSITGLQGETSYTAKLMNGTSTRGTISFTTLIDIGGAIPVHPEDDLSVVVANAQSGDVLVLYPGDYTVYKGDIPISKSITIQGLYPHNKPTIYNRFVFSAGVANATFMDLEMIGDVDADPPKLPQAFFFDPGTYTVNSVTISGCNIKNYNQALIYGGSAIVKVETLTIHNCIISNIVNDGGDFIDFRTGHVASLNITNSTFNRVAAAPRDFVRLDNSSGNFPGSVSNVVIDRCTFYQVSNSRRILYVRFFENTSTVSNTIFAGADETYTGYFTNQSTTIQPVCSKNNYYNAPAFLSSAVSGAKFDISGTHTTLNPGFVNAEGGNFTVTNQDLIFNGIGDPRWLQ
jgi:hypothetical protein